MHTKETINKALELYLSNIPINKISKQMKISHDILYKWKTKYKWEEAREETREKQVKKISKLILDEQTEIIDIAQKQLREKLDKQDDVLSQISELNSQIKSLHPKEDKEERLDLYSMLNPLVKQLLEVKDLIAIMRHGLEVVRPKQITSNLNITKNDNKIIQVNIPKEVEELINNDK